MSRFIRKITVPPVFAALLLLILYVASPEAIGGPWQLAGGMVFLALLPLAAYPLQPYLPRFRNKGRDGQRTLAMLFSALGYLLGIVTAYATDAPQPLKIVYWEYLLCGVAMLLINKLFRLKASGHACGIVGPVLMLAYFEKYIHALIGALMVIPVFIASLKTKRHTFEQLLGGSAIPAVVLVFVHLLFG